VKEHKITLLVVAVVLLLLALYFVVEPVRVNEVAVHYRPPGKVLRVINAGEKDESGLYFRFPPPIDAFKRYDKRVRVLDGPLAQTQLKDEWQVVISVYAAWRIADPVAFTESLGGNEVEAAQRLKEAIFTATSSAIGDRTMTNLVSMNEDDLQFDQLEAEISRSVRDTIQKNGYGLELVSFGLRRTAIPETTTAKVIERMEKERYAAAEHFRAEGRAERERIIAEARKDAAQITAQAEAEATRIRTEGEAEEAKYYDTFAQEPNLSIFLRRLEALRAIAKDARDLGSPITFVLNTLTPPLDALFRGPQEQQTGEPIPIVTPVAGDEGIPLGNGESGSEGIDDAAPGGD